MIFYIQGDIFKISQVVNYAHGCNCAGAMGKGIALQFKMRYPHMYSQYKDLCHSGVFSVGNVFEFNYGKGFIFNLGTQKSWKEGAKIEYVKEACKKMMEIATKNNIRSIAMPAIGAGLGGLNWNETKKMINEISKDYPIVNIYVIEEFANIETSNIFIKKKWEDEDVEFFLHFINGEAVRQIEIYQNKVIFLSTQKTYDDDSMLYDQGIEQLDISTSDYITEIEFENVWNRQFKQTALILDSECHTSPDEEGERETQEGRPGPESRIPHAILDGDSTDHEHAEGGDLGGRQCDGREGRNENMQHANGTSR